MSLGEICYQTEWPFGASEVSDLDFLFFLFLLCPLIIDFVIIDVFAQVFPNDILPEVPDFLWIVQNG